MEKDELEQYGNLPEHVRQALLATDKQPSQEPEAPPADDTPPPDTEGEPEAEQPTEVQSDPTPAEPPSNEVKAWKGRLNKEQEAHRNTNAKLLAEVEARQQAEAVAKASQEKLAALEKQLAEKPVETDTEKPKEAQGQEKPTTFDGFSEEELHEIEGVLGATGKKLVASLRKMQTAQPAEDVNQIVEQRFKQERELTAQQQQAHAFSVALAEQVPEMQGLMNHPAFTEFLNDKVIDFAGNTAAQLVHFIGQSKRVDLLPKFRELIDEFNQLQQPPKQAVTTPPSSKSAAVNPAAKAGKKKPTPEVLAQIRFLMNTGQSKKLQALQDQYDI